MGIFYQQYIDCGKEQSDYYVNTPSYSAAKNAAPKLLFFRWAPNFNPAGATVEFANYYSMLPQNQYRTTTTRGSLGTYSKYSPGYSVPLSSTVVVPGGAVNFRVRFDQRYDAVSRPIQVHSNDTLFIQDNQVFQLTT
jgi:hypothetical protein